MSIDTEHRRFVWEVNGLTKEKIERFEYGNSIVSKLFEVEIDGKTTHWKLEVYPNGCFEGQAGFVGLDLLFEGIDDNRNACGDAYDFETIHSLGIMSKKENFTGQVVWLTQADWEDERWNDCRLISHGHLLDPASEFFVDECVTFFCEFTISVSRPNNQNATADLLKDNATMFQQDELKDLELQTSDGILKCHKFVLAARSRVFKANLTSDMEEAKNNIVKIPDFNTETITQLLRYCYGLEIEDLTDIALDLIYAADKYEITGCTKVCINKIMKDLNRENVLRSLVISDEINEAKVLFPHCMDVIIRSYKDLTKTPEWKALSNCILSKVVDSLIELVKSDNDIFSSTVI